MSVVTFYDKVNYGGKSLSLDGVKDIPKFKDLKPNLNKDIASLKLKAGYVLRLYEKENFQGNYINFSGPKDIPNTDTIDMRNKIQSAKVEIIKSTGPTSSPAPPSGGLGPLFPIPQQYLPPGISNGDVIRCPGRPQIYLIENGRRRLYPSQTIYQSWGAPTTKSIPCENLDKIIQGQNMTLKTQSGISGDVPPRPDPPSVVATVYGDPSYGGRVMTLGPNESIPDLSKTSIGNNRISSIKVEPGFNVTLYPRTNYETTSDKQSITIKGPVNIPSLPETPDIRSNVKSLKVTGNGLPVKPIGTTVSGILTQTSQDWKYTRTDNSSCIDGDWKVGSDSAGVFNTGKKALCRVLQPDICPDIGGRPVKVEWNNLGNNTNKDGAQVKCTYDIGTLLTSEDINKWDNTNWDNKDQANKDFDAIIMPNYCGVKVNTCPIDPETSRRMDQCSRFVSTGKDGDICRSWAINSRTNKLGPGKSDATMIKFCNQNDTADCACLNRNKDKLYQKFTNGVPGSSTAVNVIGDVQCWWKSCQSKQNLQTTLVTSDIAKPCVTQVCAQFNTINQGKKSQIDRNEFNQKIDCSFPQPGTPTVTLPKGINNGDIIKCVTTNLTFLIQDNKKRLYPKGTAPIPDQSLNDCQALNSIPDGDPMSLQPDLEPIIPPDITPIPPEEPSDETSTGSSSYYWLFVVGGILLLLIIIGVILFLVFK